MTGTTMRERMIAALDTATAEWVKAQGGDRGMADMPAEVLVDALLAVMEAPSEAACLAGVEAAIVGHGISKESDMGDAAMCFTAMVKAIRGGA